MPSSPLYERDFYAWANEQAALLREGKLKEADIAHIAEEIESLGRTANPARIRAGRSATHESDARTVTPLWARDHQRGTGSHGGGVGAETQPRPRRRAIALALPVKGRHRRGGNQRQAPRHRARELPRANTPTIHCLP